MLLKKSEIEASNRSKNKDVHMSSMHLLPQRFDVEWSSNCSKQQQHSGRKGTANNSKNWEFRSSTQFYRSNAPFSTCSHAPTALHHAFELSTWLVVDSNRLLLSDSAILLSRVSRIFESKICRWANSRKASTSFKLPETTSHLPNYVREIHWEYVPGWLDLKGCSARSDGAKD